MPTNNKEPQFEILQMQPANTNSLLVTRGGDAIIIDAWGRASDWDELLQNRGLRLRGVYATHGHPDHISAAPDLAATHNVPWFLNAGDHDLIWWGNGLLEYFELPQIAGDCIAPTDITPGTYDVLDGVRMVVIGAAGHSAGGVMYYFPDYQILMSGDTVFRDGVGRTDLPGGNACELRASIAELHDMNLPDETFVVHGHGLDSTIEILKAENHYFKSGCDCEHKCPGTCKCHLNLDSEN